MTNLNLSTPDGGFVLLEPHKTAYACQAEIDGLAHWVGSDLDRPRAPSKEQLVETLQLMLLHDNLFVHWPPEYEDNSRRLGVGHFERDGLVSVGIVQPLPIADRWRRFDAADHTLAEAWLSVSDFATAHESVILSQLAARGIPLHWTLFRLISAVRRNDHVAAQLILSMVPHQHLDAARAIMADNEDPEFVLHTDLRLIDHIAGIDMALDAAFRRNLRVVGSPFTEHTAGDLVTGVSGASRQIWSVDWNTLADEELELPVPRSLVDVMKLRVLPELVAFRRFMSPFVDALVIGDVDAARRLHGEIRAAVTGDEKAASP